jgi:hypothetical protein
VETATLNRALILGGPVLFGRRAAPAIEAPSPPMGWNSWHAYGLTLDEKAFKANAVQGLLIPSMKRLFVGDQWCGIQASLPSPNASVKRRRPVSRSN